MINSRFLLTLNRDALRRRSRLAVGERLTGVSTPFEDEISEGAVDEVGEKSVEGGVTMVVVVVLLEEEKDIKF